MTSTPPDELSKLAADKIIAHFVTGDSKERGTHREVAERIIATAIRSLTEERDNALSMLDRRRVDLENVRKIAGDFRRERDALTARVGELEPLENMLLLCGEDGGKGSTETTVQYLRRLIDHCIQLERDVSYWKDRASDDFAP